MAVVLGAGPDSSSSLEGFMVNLNRPSPTGAQFCYGEPNSTGQRGFLRTAGTSNAAGFRQLFGSDLPPGEPSLWVVSLAPSSSQLPGSSSGVYCLGGQAYAYYGLMTAVSGSGTVSAQINAVGAPFGGYLPSVGPGSTLYYTLFHRDAFPLLDNFTNAVAVPLR